VTNGLGDRQWLGCWWETYEANTWIAFDSIGRRAQRELGRKNKNLYHRAHREHGGRPQRNNGHLYYLLMPKASIKKARVLSSLVSYRGPVFWVTTDDVLEPTGIRARRDVVRHSGSVVVLAVDESSGSPSVLLEKQYRHAAGRFLLELPAGRIDEGENALHAAKRELLEETGYSARSWKRVLHFWASPGFVAEAMSIYLARNLKAGAAQPEDDEVIELKLVPIKKAVSMVVKGTIQDAKTIAGVLWLDQQTRKSRSRNNSASKKM
jgi:ADP-ribose pyrophosphatase